MRHLLLVLPLALALPAASLADTHEAPELTRAGYFALAPEVRSLYLAGLADGLDLAAAGAKNARLSAIAACLHGFDGDGLRDAIETAEPRLEWPDDTPAAGWAVATMIQVCQLQLPPE